MQVTQYLNNYILLYVYIYRDQQQTKNTSPCMRLVTDLHKSKYNCEMFEICHSEDFRWLNLQTVLSYSAIIPQPRVDHTQLIHNRSPTTNFTLKSGIILSTFRNIDILKKSAPAPVKGSYTSGLFIRGKDPFGCNVNPCKHVNTLSESHL